MNLPNNLTTIRMALVPVFIVFFYLGQGGAQIYSILAFTIFVVASATDAIDGHIARKHNLITNFGKLMDPLADKVLTTSAFVVFVDAHIIPAWMVIVILAREFVITGLRGVAASEGVVIPAGSSGKFKTIFQMIAICLILLGIAIYGGLFSAASIGVIASPDGPTAIFSANALLPEFWLYTFVYGASIVCLWVAVALTVYSGIEYLWKGRKLFTMK